MINTERVNPIRMPGESSETNTENSVTDLVAAFLRTQSIEATTQPSITGIGNRKQPDYRITFESSVYYGEAKWDADYWQGVAEAYEYLNTIRDAKGAFAIGYPNALKNAINQRRLDESSLESFLIQCEYRAAYLIRDGPTEYFKGPLLSFSKWLNDHIQGSSIGRGPGETQVDDTPEIIDIMSQVVGALAKIISTSGRNEDLFRNVIGGSPEIENQEILNATRDAASYLLVNQITFYRVLAATGKYPELRLEAIDSPSDLQEKYFNAVLEEDYTPVFGARVSIDFPQEAIDIIKDAVRTISGLTPEKINRDVLGKVFHKLIPLALRKEVAAYYTLNETGELLANLSIDEPDCVVIDPSCGSGTLLVSSYIRKKNLLEASREFTEDDHRNFVQNQITGIDVMPFAGHLSVIHLSLQKPLYQTQEVNIGITDSTRLKKGMVIKALECILPEAESGQQLLSDFEDGPNVAVHTKKRVDRSLDLIAKREVRIRDDGYDLAIMNPPFTRFQRIAGFGTDYPDRLLKRFSGYSALIDGRMGYYAYFILLADKLLNRDGRVAAVLPNAILNGHSTGGIREYLKKNYTIEYVILREDKINFSEDTDLRETLLIAKKGGDTGGLTSFVMLKQLDPSLAPRIKRARTRTQSNGIITESGFTLRNIPQANIDATNLFRYLSLTSLDLLFLWESIENNSNLASYESLGMEIRSRDDPERGGGSFGKLMLNHPSEELMKGEVWELSARNDDLLIARHRVGGDAIGAIEIPKNSVVPAFRRMGYCDHLEVNDDEDYIVCKPFDNSQRFLDLSDCGSMNWTEWKKYVDGRMSHISIVARFDLSAPGTRILSFYSKELRAWSRANTSVIICADSAAAKVMALWNNSIFNILQIIIMRKETRGAWMEISKFILKDLKTINYTSLNRLQKRKFDQVFTQIAKEPMPSLVEQLALCCNPDRLSISEKEIIKDIFGFEDQLGKGFQPRLIIDKTIAQALQINIDLEFVYGKLLFEIAMLKRMMW